MMACILVGLYSTDKSFIFVEFVEKYFRSQLQPFSIGTICLHQCSAMNNPSKRYAESGDQQLVIQFSSRVGVIHCIVVLKIFRITTSPLNAKKLGGKDL